MSCGYCVGLHQCLGLLYGTFLRISMEITNAYFSAPVEILIYPSDLRMALIFYWCAY